MNAVFHKQMIGPLIFTLFGLLFFVIGSGLTMRQRGLEEQGIEAKGVVIDLEEIYDSDGSTYKPIVRFKTQNGQTVEFASSYSSSPPAYDIGESVTVVYQPKNPSEAVIKGDGQFLHIIFMLLGGALASIGFFKILAGIRNRMVSEPGVL